MLLLCFTRAFGEESTFEGAKGNTPTKMVTEAHASVELGGVVTSGNTETMALTGLGNLSYRWQAHAISSSFGVNWGQARIDTDGDGKLSPAEREADFVKTAERVLGSLRYDRFFGKRDSIYVLGGGFTDPFAGYDSRVNAQVGWSHSFVQLETASLRAELGADVAQEDFVAGIDPNTATVVSARLLVGGSYAFNRHVSVQDTVEAYESVLDVTDLRLNNTASLTAALGSKLSLKLSHQLAFDNAPVEGYQPLDHTTMATFVVTLL
ncbi:MAG: DUF481 domain-containing protein [Myxococcales bacterium]|nr:DUF481 domain-containing protein [Myxococcales bacterium]